MPSGEIYLERLNREAHFACLDRLDSKLDFYQYYLLFILGRFPRERFLGKKKRMQRQNSKGEIFAALSVTFSLLHSCSLSEHFLNLNLRQKTLPGGLQRLPYCVFRVCYTLPVRDCSVLYLFWLDHWVPVCFNGRLLILSHTNGFKIFSWGLTRQKYFYQKYCTVGELP